MPPVKKIEAPKLTNRGGAGLLGKLTPEQKAGIKPVKVEKPILTQVVAKHRIAPSIAKLAVDISTLKYDPENARLHPEKNKEAIVASLRLYGQVKPIVVNKRTGIVVAGNGTLEAARSMGWETIAVSFVEMSDVEAAGYGLADNRTAELAKWDFEVVARLDRLMQEAGHETIGWSKDELEVLRAAEWVPPEITDESFVKQDETNPCVITFDEGQFEQVQQAIDHMREIQGSPDLSLDGILYLICGEWLKAEMCGRLEGLDEEKQEGSEDAAD